MPPPQVTGGGGSTPQSVTLSSPVTRTMPGDLRRLSGANPGSISGSGKVLWPSQSSDPTPKATPPGESVAPQKAGFLSSLLQSRHHDDVVAPVSVSPAQKIPVQGLDAPQKGSVWDERVPAPLGKPGVPSTPKSALPIPQRPIVNPVHAPQSVVPQRPPEGVMKKEVPLAPIPSRAVQPPQIFPKPQPVPPAPTPVAPKPTPSIIQTHVEPPRPPVKAATMPAPSIGRPTPPAPAPQPKPVPPPAPRAVPPEAPLPKPRPLPRPDAPRILSPVSLTPKPAPKMEDPDIGIDLGISEYLKGGPTFQIDHASAPIPSQGAVRTGSIFEQKPQIAQVSMSKPAPVPAPSVGGVWNPPRNPQVTDGGKMSAQEIAKAESSVTSPATIFAPTAQSKGVAQTRDAVVPQHVSAKPTQSNSDLDAEKQRLIGERAQIAGAKSAIEAALKSLLVDRQQADNQIKPIVSRENDLAREIDELERKEQGLTGEVRRAVERDRWTKAEERRKVEQERLLIKKRLASVEGDVHAKEEEQVSLIKREKDIDARIAWIDLEYKRREVRMKLAEVNQEKAAVESHRTILDNGLKRLKASLEETEKNERRLMEEKRVLAVKLPQTVAEEERFSQERFDIEKQMHDMEVRRWGLEDELKNAQEMFSKEDMTYLDVMHRAEALQGELKSLG